MRKLRYLVVSLFIIVLSVLGILRPVRSFFHFALVPVQLGLQDTAKNIKDTLVFFSHLKELRSRNIALSEENISLRAEIVELKIHAEENTILRDQLGVLAKDPFDRELLLANVIGNSNDLTNATVYIDKGLHHDVSTGAIVVVGNHLVGRVVESGTNRSLVSLITSPDISMTAFDLFSGTQGVVVGSYATSLDMIRILPEEPIALGDVIVTSGKDGLFIPELVIGEVTDVIEVSTEPLKSAKLKPLIDLSNLRKVFVLSIQ